MTELFPTCFNWPPVLLGAACALAGFVAIKWARTDEARLPRWRWGDAPRRPSRDPSGLLAHFAGAMIAAAAISYVVNHPFCG